MENSQNPQTPQSPKNLTVADPVPMEVLGQFSKLDEARFNLGGRLLLIEQDRVRILAAAHRIDEQKQRLFEQILMERGLPITTQVEIDSKTGILTLLGMPEGEAPAIPPPPVPVKEPENPPSE